MDFNWRISYGVIVLFAVIFAVSLPAAVQGHGHRTLAPASAPAPALHAPVPAPAPAATSDGTTIDQGIACGLMLLALVLTYLIHTLDVLSVVN